MATFGSARHNEFGGISGGQRGDQTGDEVCTQEAYLHSSGWDILRANDLSLRTQLANKMLQACNNSNVGYDQPERELIYTDTTSSNIPTHCDCSSLVCQIVRECGIQCNNFSTHTEIQELLSTGQFTQIQYTSLDDLETGDILVDSSHTHHTGIITQGRQLQWITKVGVEPSMTQSEMENNAQIFYGVMTSLGFSFASIVGLLGNIQQESQINCGCQQSSQMWLGLGLIQWSAENSSQTNPLIIHAQSVGKDWYDEQMQCELINSEGYTGAWITTSGYPTTWDEFKALTDYEYATRCYCYNRERAGQPEMENRLRYASYWNDYLGGITPPEPPEPPTPPPPTEYHSMPLWFYLKRKI